MSSVTSVKPVVAPVAPIANGNGQPVSIPAAATQDVVLALLASGAITTAMASKWLAENSPKPANRAAQRFPDARRTATVGRVWLAIAKGEKGKVNSVTLSHTALVKLIQAAKTGDMDWMLQYDAIALSNSAAG